MQDPQALPTPTPLFHVCTLVNDKAAYARMKSSFAAAGMDSARCRYSIFDNTGGNQFEPYTAINEAIRGTVERYLVVCHQDVLMDRGDGFDRLVAELEALDRGDPSWAVAGNAGVTDRLSLVIRISDPCAADRREGCFADPVATLDENFLVIRPDSGVRCSTNLSGFHLYGTDLCLRARAARRTCYVLDFHLSHLSAGNPDSEAYSESLRRLVAEWNHAFTFAFVPTMFTTVFLSRYRPLRRMFGSAACLGWVQAHRRRFGALSRLCAPLIIASRRPNQRRNPQACPP